jgi:molybdate transport system ATP-binding protein
VPTEPVLDADVALDVGALRLRAALATTSRRLAVVGPSGAGKSTFLRVLAGLEPKAGGRLAFRGVPWMDAARRLRVPPHRRGVGWVPQDVRLFPHASVRENLRFSGASDAEALDLARRLGVDALLDRRPRHLSGGEAQRVALARALLSRPRLLLLDEPFAAQDRARRADLSALLHEVVSEKDTVLVLVSHDERDVSSLAEEVHEMSEGALQGRGDGRG